jgi:hypothetical protein
MERAGRGASHIVAFRQMRRVYGWWWAPLLLACGTDAASDLDSGPDRAVLACGTDAAGDLDSGPDCAVIPIDETACTPWDGATVHAEFVIPGAKDAKPGDYFRLPYPNDISRNEDGTVDLSGFPARTAIAQQFVDAVSGELTGFSNYTTITLRFSGRVDYDGLADRVVLLDVTDPEAPLELGRTFEYAVLGGTTVCHDSVSIRVPDGRPLTPGHTYVAGVRHGLKDEDGRAVESAPHFQALLAAARPDDAAFARAYRAYEPMRRYLEAAGDAAIDWLTAAVFTTDEPNNDMSALAELVRAAEPPELTNWAHCGSAPSPCGDVSDNRDCGPENAAYDEYHALVQLPIFQKGNAPYVQSGGSIDFGGPIRLENVCVAVAIPRAEPPSAGFPLVVFGHGAGGSFRSALTPSIAERLALATDDDGNARPVATLGFDQVAHGPRRGTGIGSTFDPELLLFNLLNPASGRGTTLQAGADLLALEGAVSSPGVGTEIGVAFDTTHLAYWGHSQGGSQGAIALPFSDGFTAAVFSGTGAGIVHALLDRDLPEAIPVAVRDSVADPGPDGELVLGGLYHPMLGVLQHWVDAVDPLNFAGHLVQSPLPQHAPKHVFSAYGLGDSYAPPTNLRNFLVQAGLEGVAAHVSAVAPEDLGPEFDPPLAGNHEWRELPFTAGFRQYGPPIGEDGHFVAFAAEAANDDVIRFLVQATYGEVPEIGAPR